MFKTINKQPNSPVYFTKKKVKLTGYVIEVDRYEHEFMLFYRNKRKTESRQRVDIRKKSMFRAKRLITDYINTNAWHWYDTNKNRIQPLFLSLTFRENLKDLNIANYEFTKFIRRVNYELYGSKKSLVKYICVVEFQKRGAVHYHLVIFNLPYVERIYDKFRMLWPHGSSNVESVKTDKGSIGGYLTKYLTKEKTDDRLVERKSYFISRGLLKPIVSSLEDVVLLVENNLSAVPVAYEYKSKFQIGEKCQEKHALIYDLKNDLGTYQSIVDILKTYEY